MAKLQDRAKDRAGDVKPYIERALKDERVREDVKSAIATARGIYDELIGGKALTSVATNDSDATIHYQWQSSTDGGQTWTAIAGAADSANYVVQQSDENNDIRVVATTSDPDNSLSATATSAATGPVIDNASLSLAVSVVGNGAAKSIHLFLRVAF